MSRKPYFQILFFGPLGIQFVLMRHKKSARYQALLKEDKLEDRDGPVGFDFDLVAVFDGRQEFIAKVVDCD